MAVEVILPKLGMAMDEGTILAWLKQEGEEIKQGEPLFEIETDKVEMVVESPGSGILRKVYAKKGSTVPVGQVIAVIAQPGEQAPESHAPVPTATSIASKEEAKGGVPGQRSVLEQEGASKSTETHPASPAAKKLAREHGVDLRRVVGSGPGGRIVESDVMKIIEDRGKAVDAPSAPGAETVVLSAARRKAAQRMAESFQTIPHFYLTVEARADHLRARRESLLGTVEKEVGVRLSFTDLFAHYIALALKQHPLLNASWQGGEIRLNREINIGIAMATKEGLVVPVIHKADTLSLAEIAKRRTALAADAMQKKLSLDAMQGGTFTLTNLGSYGIDAFSPIINPPQAAILATGKIAERAIARGGTLASCPTVFLTLAADHRVLDGAEGAAFLKDLKDLIEQE